MTVKKKISFKLPRQSNYLFYDYLPRFEKILKKNYEKINFRQEINLFVLLFSFFFWYRSRFNFKLSYIYSYISFVNPKIIFTFTDNDLLFYKLKKNNISRKFISIQNGTRSISGDIFSYNFSSKDKYECDKIYAHNFSIANKFKEIIKTETIISGSLLNNFHKKKIFKKKKFDITFISQYENKSDFNFTNYLNEIISWKKYYSAENKILNILKKFCLNRKLTLNICARFRENNDLEFEFYNNILGDNFQFTVPDEDFNQYDICDSSNLIVFIDSTLGYESFSRNNKTVGFSVRGEIINDPSYNFGWPNQINKNGSSWISYYDKNRIEEILKNNFDMTINRWIELNSSVRNELLKIEKNISLNKELFK